MFVPDDAGQRIHDDFAVDEHRDTITCPCKCVQIVSHHHHRQTERAAQVKDEVVEGGGSDRIQARGGFIEKQQRWIDRAGLEANIQKLGKSAYGQYLKRLLACDSACDERAGC